MTRIGFIGLGAMGSRIAGRLLDGGHSVVATNRTMDKAQALIARGLDWRDTPREVAAAAEVLFSMVTDDDALDSISTGPDGLLAGLQTRAVYVDMSTVSPQASRRLADRVHERGAQMLDAPVSGSIPQAEAGTLAIMVGGDPLAFASVEPLLHELGQTVTRIGPNGQGLVLKLAINISLAVQTLAFSEGLVLAERAGVDPALAADVMSSTAIGSPMLKARIPMLLDLPETAWFDVELAQKDIRLARQTATDLGVTLPSATVADEILTQARNLGYGHRDLASVHDVLAQAVVRGRRLHSAAGREATSSVAQPGSGGSISPRTKASATA